MKLIYAWEDDDPVEKTRLKYANRGKNLEHGQKMMMENTNSLC